MLALRYAAHSICFQYAPDMKASAFPRPGRGMNIRVEASTKHGNMFGAVIMTYLEPTSPEKAFEAAREGIEMVYQSDASKLYKRTASQRTIAGSVREGARFEVEWERHPCIELYAFDLNGRTLCVSLQYDAEDAANAEQRFGPILAQLQSIEAIQ